MKRWIIGLITIILLSLSCKKEYEFPDITQEGKGTFGCKIDGRVYVPRTEHPPFSTYLNSFMELLDDGMINFSISVSHEKTNTMGPLRIRYQGSPEGLKPGKYSMNGPGMDPGGYSAEYEYRDVSYRTREGEPSEIVITRFDCIEGIISGTFRFTLLHPTSDERIEVTEGRFDVKIR